MTPDDVSAVVRDEAQSLIDASESRLDPRDEWVAISADDAGSFIEPLSSVELLARLRDEGVDVTAETLACVDHPIRIAVHHGGQALIAGYADPADVPEAPAAHAWLERLEWGTELATRFASLRDADGLRPWNPEALAMWALETQDPQALGAVALIVEVTSSGRTHRGSAVEWLFATLPGGMKHFFREIFDDAHREAASRILRDTGRPVPAR